jgi:2'-5' RNA ligase
MQPIQPRLFIAVPIPNHLRAVLKHWCDELKLGFQFKKWVDPADYHITLKYLGVTDFVTAQQVKNELKKLTKEIEAFTLVLTGLGTFGQPESPRILWSGVQGEMNSLVYLQKKIEEEINPLGFEKEDRVYNPHLTLARKYQGEQSFDENDLTRVVQPKEDSLNWQCKEIVLYQSHLNRSPMYQPLAVYPLKSKL